MFHIRLFCILASPAALTIPNVLTMSFLWTKSEKPRGGQCDWAMHCLHKLCPGITAKLGTTLQSGQASVQHPYAQPKLQQRWYLGEDTPTLLYSMEKTRKVAVTGYWCKAGRHGSLLTVGEAL